jgi:rubrerythrin
MYRCRICGETYLGSEVPSHCPFCGAHRDLIVDTMDYPEDINNVNLTEVERNDLLQAVELERSNTQFYLAMGAHKDNLKLSSTYKRLAKIEAEHCEVFSKLLGQDKPADLMTPGDASDDWCANIDDSLAREKHASEFYAEVVGRATNERVREVFAAVSEIEQDHIVLDHLAKDVAGC